VGHTADMRERLTPPWWVFVIGAIVPAMIGVAYGAAFNPWLGMTVFIVGTALVATFLVRTSPVVTAAGTTGLTAGRAHLPMWAVGRCECLSLEEARERLRTDGSAYLVLRAWYSKRVLVVAVDDAEDPHRRWYLSLRDPQACALVLQGG
jgi:hypothetical protein